MRAVKDSTKDAPDPLHLLDRPDDGDRARRRLLPLPHAGRNADGRRGALRDRQPYAEADLFDIHYVQSADVLTLVHPNRAARVAPAGALSWSLTTISFVSRCRRRAACRPRTRREPAPRWRRPQYKVTAVGAIGIDESLASAEASVSGDLLLDGAYNTITWSAVSGAQRYNVYKQSSGLFGYIGQTDGLSFQDDNIAADIPHAADPVQPFSGAGNTRARCPTSSSDGCSPARSTRRKTWMTRTGTESNLSYSLPTKDDDAIAFRVAAREANTIRHLIPLDFADGAHRSAEWRVTSVNSDAITPSSVAVRPQSTSVPARRKRWWSIPSILYGPAVGPCPRARLQLAGRRLHHGRSVFARAAPLRQVRHQRHCVPESPAPVAWFVSSSASCWAHLRA